MFYADPSTAFAYPDGSVGIKTPFPFATWAMFRNVR